MRDFKSLRARASGWVLDNLANFDPLIWTEKKAAYTRRKAFAELAIYAYIEGDGLAPEIGDFITRIANHPDYHSLLHRNPRQLLLYSAPIGFVIARGAASRETFAALDAVLACPQVMGVERSAHRLMDLWQFLTLTGRCPECLDARAILATSALAHPPTPFDCTLAEAYALTHDVLFLRNFGVVAPQFARAPDMRMDPDSTALQIVRFMAEENSDIVLEFLICLGLSGQVNGADAQLILDWIVARNGDAPYIAGPRFDPDTEMAYSGLDQDWVANYHTTLVGLALLVLTERHGWLDGAAPQLLPETAEHAVEWGTALRAFNSYELPRALAVTDVIDRDGGFDRVIRAAIRTHVRRLTDPQTGLVGHWTDEMMAARTTGVEKQFRADLEVFSDMARAIVAPKAA
jgi:hypothetical protein